MLRLLYVSVRGHKILLGGPTLDADAPVPDGVGIGFPTLAAIKQHVSTELRGLSAYWQVQVVDETGTLIHRGFRTGHNGTGEHWTWQPVVHEGDTALRPGGLGRRLTGQHPPHPAPPHRRGHGHPHP